MSHLDRFRITRLSDDLRKEYQLPEFICANPESMPFPEGQAFCQWLVDDNACEPVTAHSYLGIVLPFFTFLWGSSPSLRYTAPAEQIRYKVGEYLSRNMGCGVRPHPNGNFVVKSSGAISRHSVRLFLTAIKRFYECANWRGWYADPNPLVWQAGVAARANAFRPHMPPVSGMTQLEERRGRIPETYFCLVADHWQPRIIDDPNLPKLLLAAFTNNRDCLIARILFESGARVGEVLRLTLGDWRNCGQRERALATNKGSRGVRTKEIWWSSATVRFLHNYINKDRCDGDPLGRRLTDLPDSAQIFITDEGNTYTYPAFYFNWQAACRKAGLKVTPHQARHWFVTMALHKIESLPEAKRAAARESLIAYMAWRNAETIQAYDHHIRRTDFSSTHAALSRLVSAGDDGPVAPPAETAHSGIGAIPGEMMDRLSQLIDE